MAYIEYTLSSAQTFVGDVSDSYPDYAEIGGDGTYIAILSFQLSELPKDSVINSAYIQFTSDVNSEGKSTPVSVKYYSRLESSDWWSDDRLDYTAYAKSSGESESITASWVTGSNYNSIDITTTVQECIDLYDYIGSKDIVISIEGDGNADNNYTRSISFSSGLEPVLFIDFSLPEAPEESVLVTTEIADIYEPDGYSYYPSGEGGGAYVGYNYSAIQNALARFPLLPVPSGATILSAELTIENTYGSAASPVKIAVRAIKTVDADCPADRTEYDLITLTDAVDTAEIATVGYGEIVTFDVSDIIEEVVNLSGWNTWDSIVFSLKDNGTDQTQDNSFYFQSVQLSITIDLNKPPGISPYAGMNLEMSQAAIEAESAGGLIAEMSQAIILVGSDFGAELGGAGLIVEFGTEAGIDSQGAMLILAFGREHGNTLSLSGWVEPMSVDRGISIVTVLPPAIPFNALGTESGLYIKGASSLASSVQVGMVIVIQQSFTGNATFSSDSGFYAEGASVIFAGRQTGLVLNVNIINQLSLRSISACGFTATVNSINAYLAIGSNAGLSVSGEAIRIANLKAGIKAGLVLTGRQTSLANIELCSAVGITLTCELDQVINFAIAKEHGFKLSVLLPCNNTETFLLHYKR